MAISWGGVFSLVDFDQTANRPQACCLRPTIRSLKSDNWFRFPAPVFLLYHIEGMVSGANVDVSV